MAEGLQDQAGFAGTRRSHQVETEHVHIVQPSLIASRQAVI